MTRHARRLQTNHGRCVGKYTRYVEPEFRRQHFVPRLNALRRQTTRPTNNTMIEEIKAIDQERTKMLRNVNTKFVWSKLDKYTILQMTYNTTEMKYSYGPWWIKKSTQQVNTILIWHKAKQCGIPNCMSFLKGDVIKHQKETWSRYQEAKKTDQARQNIFFKEKNERTWYQ